MPDSEMTEYTRRNAVIIQYSNVGLNVFSFSFVFLKNMLAISENTISPITK